MRLQYELAATGQNQIRTVLRGVEREAAASNRRMATDATRTARQTARSTAGSMFAPGRREQMAALRAQEREQIKVERARLREALASSKAEARARLADERNLARAKESLDRQRSRSLLALHREEDRARRGMARGIGRGALRATGGAIGRTAAVGGTALGLVGGIAVGSALAEESAIRRRASVLANKANNPALKGALAAESTQIQGFSGSESLGALDAFMGKTGDLDAGRAALKDIGALALATDADFVEMGEAAGNAFNVIADAISDPQKRIEALNKVLRGWAGQGNIGSVEMSDMAQFGGRLGGASRKFAGDPADLLLSMGAMAQAAVRGGGASDAAEATTGVARFGSDLTKKPAQKALAKLGVDVFSDKNKTHLKDPGQIVAEMLEKTKGSLPMSEDIVNAESGKVLAGFSDIFTKAEAIKRGSGKDAVLAEFQRYKSAGMSDAAVATGVASRMEDPDLQFKEAMKQFNTAVGKDLLPALTKLIPEFTALIPEIGGATREVTRFISFLAENPLSGIMAIMGASVAADVAQAGISSALESGVSSLVGGMSAAQIGMAKFAGASVLAAAAIYAAHDQNEALKKETGGLGIFDLVGGALEGKGLFEQVEENMNRQARERAEREPLAPPGTLAAQGSAVAAAMTPGTPASVPNPAAGAAGGAALVNGGAALERAAGALEKAAAAMPKAGGKGVPEAARSAPIVSPSRG